MRPAILSAAAGERLELGQERVVDEVEQRVAGDAFVVLAQSDQRRCCGSGDL